MKKLLLITLLGATVGSAWGAAGQESTNYLEKQIIDLQREVKFLQFATLDPRLSEVELFLQETFPDQYAAWDENLEKDFRKQSFIQTPYSKRATQDFKKYKMK